MKNRWGNGRHSLLATTLKMATAGLATIGLTSVTLGAFVPLERLDRAYAQVPVTPSPTPSTPAAVRTLYVNAAEGNDSSNGSPEAPMRTITAALQQAATGTVIQLAPGTYSAESGEVFPLHLPSGVVLRGDESNYGVGYDIVGGGDFISPTLARQSITILPKDGAEIRGVSVRNEGRRGYAVWMESTSPTIEHNTFTGSVHDGVFLAGSSAATISNNRFYRNGANGISVLGTSTPTIVGNLIQETGYGIAIGQNSRPVVAHNRIARNRSGLVITGRAQPVLRNNLIAENLEDGLVAIAEALPNLGTTAEAGGNRFENNGNYNIHNATQGSIIHAHGNVLGDENKIEGEVAFNPGNSQGIDVASVPGLFDEQQQSQASPVGETAYSPVTQAEPSGQLNSTVQNESIPQATPSTTETNTAAPDPMVTPSTVSGGDEFRPVPFVFEGTPPDLESRAPQSEDRLSDDDLNLDDSDLHNSDLSGPAGGAGTAPAHRPESSLGGDNTSQNVSNRSTPRRGVPIPIANTNDIVSAARRYPARYRVLITPQSGDTIEAVRAVAPTATPAQLAGREVYLVGHYTTHSEAQTVLEQLTQKGYLATAEAIEREVDS